MFQQGTSTAAPATSHSNLIHDLIGPGSSATSSLGSIITTSASASAVAAAAAIAQASGVNQPVNSATLSHSPSPRYYLKLHLIQVYI
jgi:hypothetical protein